MTLDATKLARYTPFSVGTTATDTVMLADDFTDYCSLAVARLTRELPSTISSGSATYDLLEAYLVAHLFVSKDPSQAGEFQSESISGYSYSKKGDIKAGSTYWEARYNVELAQWGKRSAGSTSAQMERTDSVLPKEFQLDENFADDDNFDGDTNDGVRNFDGVT